MCSFTLKFRLNMDCHMTKVRISIASVLYIAYELRAEAFNVGRRQIDEGNLHLAERRNLHSKLCQINCEVAAHDNDSPIYTASAETRNVITCFLSFSVWFAHQYACRPNT